MDTSEKKDDYVKVEDIMFQIRENIKKRKDDSSFNEPTDAATGKNLQDDIDFINSNWNVSAEYRISSHRPVIGRLIIWGRKLFHGEVRRYVDLIEAKQIEFNTHVARCINILDNKIDETIATTKIEFNSKINETTAAINKDVDLKINKAVPAEVNYVVASVNNDINNKAWLANLLDERINSNLNKTIPLQHEAMNYYLFEEKFRGSTEDITERQSIYIEYFKNCKNVLDIGCGRGEFLSLMKGNYVGAKGIDINEDMVIYCKKNGLDAQEADAMSYLQSLRDKALDGVFSSQVVEHLQPVELINLIKLSYDKMKYGTYFVAETVNPLCLSVLTASFYIDLSHVKPVHPETIKFLMESVGFREIEFKFLSPFPDYAKLSRLVINENMSPEERARLDMMNQNIDKLNSLLYGYQDYAVIGKK